MSQQLPADGSTIRFVFVPRGSYASPGVEYRVQRQGRWVHLRRVDGGSATSDAAWAYADALWATVPALMDEAA